MKPSNDSKWKNKTTLLLCATLMSACATLPPYVELSQHAKFVGVATIRSPDSPARRAKLTWERVSNGDVRTDITEIKTPLGTTQARLTMDKNNIKIEVGGRVVDSDELQGEAKKWTEMLPPGDSVGYWMLGKPDPDYSARETIIPGEQGVSRIYQHDWEIEYVERDEDGLPLRIILRAPEPDNEAEIKIVKWLTAP